MQLPYSQHQKDPFKDDEQEGSEEDESDDSNDEDYKLKLLQT